MVSTKFRRWSILMLIRLLVPVVNRGPPKALFGTVSWFWGYYFFSSGSRVHQLELSRGNIAFLHGPLGDLDGLWNDTAYLLLYVDDIVLTASFETLLRHIIASLRKEFFMIDLRIYAVEILERAHMVNCNPSRTPVDAESKLGDDGDPVSDPTLYRSLACSLQYLTFTRPDISYAVQQLRNLLRKLHTPLSSDTLVYCDNVSAVYLSLNLVHHQLTKHIEIDIHFVRDLVATGQVRVLHVPSRYQYADIFTKGLPSALFEEFRTSLSVRCHPTQTVREC
ncbi:ribonuclease H-like domain-containing protein [Tanacetum coccineum]